MGAAEGPEKPITLFYSYSHRDERLRKKLEDHLAALRRSEMIAEWHDRNIDVGDEWSKEIDDNLSSADIILLLVSATFIASDYCWSVEMTKALERHDKGEAKVIPVILRRCSWHTTPFAKLQAAPTDAKPVTRWSDQDEALHDVVRKIERAVTDLQQQRRREAEEAQQEAEEARKRQATKKQQREALRRQREQVEAQKKHAAAEARQVAEQQQREAQQRREQDEARRAAEAKAARVQKRFADFAVFRDIDAPWCPEMVALPAGEFLRDPPKDKDNPRTPLLMGRQLDAEGLRVTIASRFAIGRYPVTVGEYGKFAEATGGSQEGGIFVWTGTKMEWDRSKSWRDPGFAQTDAHPVVGVSWRDVQAYLEWLSRKASQVYRLPSEAEWEYACQGETTTPFSHGQKTVPVGSLLHYPLPSTRPSTHPWLSHLHEMPGNVMEWVEGWHDSYFGAPAAGLAWTDWEGINYPVTRSSIVSMSGYPDFRCDNLGFRVARTLD